MRQISLSLTVLSLLLALTSLASSAEPGAVWTKVFQMSNKAAWFACVLAEQGREWTAAGKDVLVVGSGATAQQFSLDGAMMQSFGVDGGTAFAVGSQASIWRQVTRTEWRLEHRLPQESKPANWRKETLLQLRPVASPSARMLVAFGWNPALTFQRSSDGTWKTFDDPALAKRSIAYVMEGPPLTLPKNCARMDWRWVDGEDGFGLCPDRRGFSVHSAVLAPVGKLPASCDVLRAVVRRGDELFTSCGSGGVLLRYSGNRWNAVPGMRNIRALSANDRCVVVASDQAVWQQCSN